MRYPSISIITATLNPHIPTFTNVLESIKIQQYPGELEHIILDGGTTNGALEIAKKYGCKILRFKDSVEEGGSRLYVGLKKAKGKLILILESDNILPHKLWLLNMVEPFKEKGVFSTFPAYNTYSKEMSLLTKYCALFGSPDPTLLYLHKSDKIPVYIRKYDKGKIVKETKDYWVVTFTKDTLPTVGDNGYLVDKKTLQKVVLKNQTYIHVDAFSELLEQGFSSYGVTKDSIVHTTRSSILDAISRRVEVKRNFYDLKRGKRKYLVYNPNSTIDRINLLKYVLFSITFIIPLIESIRGYLKIREKAWFLHPVMCFAMVVAYGYSEVKWIIKKDKSIYFLNLVRDLI